MHLLQAFRDFIAKERLFSPQDRLLLAVSGGIDSVVLCELARQADFDFRIAHCNFQLRGPESDRDETFVADLARHYGRDALVRRFDTEAYARTHRQSIQEAARELRYGWFHELIAAGGQSGGQPGDQPGDQSGDQSGDQPGGQSGGQPGDQPTVIVTAHHLDDNIETLVMNFFKGTGIAGLRAMLPRQGKIVRPLLFAAREEIRRFAADHQLCWVEDSSNETDHYTRNFFRHRILPLVEEAYPAAWQNLAANLDRFRGIEQLYRQAIGREKKKLLEHRGQEVHIPVERLKKAAPLLTLIHEIFSPYGFTPQQTAGIASLLDSPTGKYICSRTHRLLRNRNWLILSPLLDTSAATILVETDRDKVEFQQGTLHLERLAPSGPPPADPVVAWLDAKQIVFPLILRPWRPGDYFYPLGMRKKKKLARFFIDQRLSLAEKEKTWVLEMDKKILWVIGRRIDDRFRITPATKEVLAVRFTSAAG